MAKLENVMKGRCMHMCPLEEIKMREKEHLLHILEMIPGTEKSKNPKASRNHMVKCFSRSAAGKQIKAEDLRPPEILLKTVRYLLCHVIKSKKLPFHMIYDYITDRLMAVRQDMVVQDASQAESIAILQPIVRFYAFAAYRLCQANTSNFDPVLNNKNLQECLKKLLYLYDGCEYLTKIDSVSSQYIEESRPEFEALYLLFNMGNDEALRRGLALPQKYKSGIVGTALEISLSYRFGNFVRVCRSIGDLPTLLKSAAALRLPQIRRKAFQVMSVAYHSKNLSLPTTMLQDLLLYGSVDELLKDCKHYGIKSDNERIYFKKESFDYATKTASPKRESFVDQTAFEESVESLILGL